MGAYLPQIAFGGARMSYTVITTDRGHQTAVVAASEIDVLSIARAAQGGPGEAVTVFTKTGRRVSIAELEPHGAAEACPPPLDHQVALVGWRIASVFQKDNVDYAFALPDSRHLGHASREVLGSFPLSRNRHRRKALSRTMSKRSRKAPVREQYGAAPYRIGPDGDVQVLLVTTRETHRWMVPKGWPIKKLGPLGTALREAYEEAGVRGDGGPAIGSFDYLKVMRKGPNQICEVEVFPLLVREELEDWPEKAERERRWFKPEEASNAVQEEPLRALLLRLPVSLGRV